MLPKQSFDLQIDLKKAVKFGVPLANKLIVIQAANNSADTQCNLPVQKAVIYVYPETQIFPVSSQSNLPVPKALIFISLETQILLVSKAA